MKYICALSLILGMLASENIFSNDKKFESSVKPVQRAQASEITYAKEPSKVQKAFIEKTKIKLGQYVLAADSDINCLEGELSIIDLGDRITLMLGARPIAQSIGKKKYEEKELDGCKATFDTTYTETQIFETREKICKKDRQTLKSTVNISEGKLLYATKITTNGDLNNEFTCELRWVVPSGQ